MPQLKKPENINNSYFRGLYKEIWRSVIPDELSVKEVNFMLDFFKLKPGDRVLDVMCGYGRHAIGLARKGIRVTAVDNLEDYITEIMQTTQKENLPVTPVCDDIMHFTTDDKFDLSVCMGNSLNFFNAEETGNLLALVSSHLKPGGIFFINTWSITEIVTKHFKEKSWSRFGNMIFLSDCNYLFQPARIEIESTIIAPDGTTEIKKAVDYIFSLNELDSMLYKAGFIMKDIYSIPGKKKFSIGESRAYIVAEKR